MKHKMMPFSLRVCADEMRAKRWQNGRFLASCLDKSYEFNSNYGQSILRPSIGLFLFFVVFSGLFNCLPASKVELSRFTNEQAINHWRAAGELSATNILPFIPLSREVRKEALEYLYGDYDLWGNIIIKSHRGLIGPVASTA